MTVKALSDVSMNDLQTSLETMMRSLLHLTHACRVGWVTLMQINVTSRVEAGDVTSIRHLILNWDVCLTIGHGLI